MSDPSILCHPNIPKPLHGIAPRVVLGKAWWDRERQKAYANAGFCCEACGVHKRDAKHHQWLEAHEYYDYDYAKGLLKLNRLVALCHSCHNFIHSGRLEMLLMREEISEEKYRDIVSHGQKVLMDAGLLDKWSARHDHDCTAQWKDWRMEINGTLYGPSSGGMDDWRAGAWRNWKPQS